MPPRAPEDESESLRAELQRLQAESDTHRASLTQSARQVQELEARLRQAEADRLIWEQLAAEADQSKAALARKLEEQQEQAKRALPQDMRFLFAAADAATKKLELDEFETRKLIDQQLRDVGWEADSEVPDYRKGVRSQPHRFLAIAEWPISSGP